MVYKILGIIFTLALFPGDSSGHGRLMDPPNRSSLWRFGFKAEPNYDDNGLNCGGKGVQYDQNNGKCGVCGDNYADQAPRRNEDGGFFGRGIITKSYRRGGVLPVTVELTASHLGYFEFGLCDLSQSKETEECFKPLTLLDGSTRFPVTSVVASTFKMALQIPNNVICSRCVLRWHYKAGNSFGSCGNGGSSVNAANQEIFRNCADIAIF